MFKLNNLKVKYKLLVLIGVAVFGFVLLSVNFYRTLIKVEVNGELYNNIIRQKDLLADILPPPEYLVESYLIALQMSSTVSKEELPALIAQSKKLREDYDTRHQYWEKELTDPQTREVFLKASYDPAMKFFQVFDNEFLPAIQSGDQQKAREIAEGPLKKHYMTHRAAIDDVVKMATKNSLESEAEAASILYSSNIWLVAIGLLIITAFVAAGWYIANLIASPLGEITGKLEAMSEGDINQRFDYSGSDEIGKLAVSFHSITDYIRTIATSVDALAAGDLSKKVTIRSDRDALSKNLNRAVDSLQELINETKTLNTHARNGDISFRGETNKYGGSYRELLEGINSMLEAVAQPISEASECLQRVAKRDLTAEMTGDYKGQFAKIKESLNTALKNLDEGMSQISDGAEQVAEAAGQISLGSASLAQSSSEQASTLEEVASSVQEISSMTRQNSANSLEARSLAENARRTTVEGKNNMNRLNEAVGKIKASSDSTVKIVKTIEEIAFQTNLLALNAAVEAARAGDAGKGFAVVAEEVRNLAMRSADAAKTTAQLIDESVQNTLSGVVIHNDVSKNLDDILDQIEKVSAVSAEIAAATEQQSEGIEQINSAFDQMNIVTQQTAANSEESASSAEELSGQSQEMLTMIGSFKIGRTRGMAPTFAATRRSAPRMQYSPKNAVPARSPAKRESDLLIPFDDDHSGVLSSF